ncbi:MAG: twin-arginine translocation signal domain-containing protein [Sedimentisphaerales bacterium]|nr:twin-arginine translocation signal domain-containing protein [Sedimentisphaerales bacterium]
MSTNRINRRGFLKAGLAGAAGIALTPLIKPLENICKGDEIYRPGLLNFYNYIVDVRDKWPFWIIHRQEALEEFEGDVGYDSTYLVPFDKPNSKVVSILEEKTEKIELEKDARPLESFSPINLELSVHTEGDPITLSCANNLKCILPFPGEPYFYDFGVKPITLWRRFPSQPEQLQFLADIREVIAKNSGLVPLPFLNRTLGNQEVYEWLQVRFDVYAGDIDLNGIVDVKDLNYIGKDWKRQGQPLEYVGDITGPQGIPDGNVDARDLEMLTRHHLKDIREIMP